VSYRPADKPLSAFEWAD